MYFSNNKAADSGSGLTDSYIKVHAKSAGNLTNQFRSVKLVGLRADGMRGTLL